MMRSLFSGVSGLKVHQTRMDVIGNNIANINTIGYKSSRTTFSDMLSQLSSSAAAPTDGLGGVNAKQIGLGVDVESIDIIFTDSSPQQTGKNTDLALSGNGLFVLKNGNQSFYTRNGAFMFDEDGYYVMPGNGLRVQGWNAIDGVINTNGTAEDIIVPVGKTMEAAATRSVDYSGNLNKESKLIESISYNIATGGNEDLVRTVNAAGTTTSINVDGTNVTSATLKMRDGTEVKVTSGYYEVGRSIPVTTLATVYDSLGGTHQVTVLIDKDAYTEDANANAEATETSTGYVFVDTDGSMHAVTVGTDADGNPTYTYTNAAGTEVTDTDTTNLTTAYDNRWRIYLAPEAGTQGPAGTTFTNTINATESDGTTMNAVMNSGAVSYLYFDTTGKFVTNGREQDAQITFNYGNGNGAEGDQQATISFIGMTQYANSTTSFPITDGNAAGILQSLAIDGNGIISGTYTNGLVQQEAQIAVAQFNNSSGLTRNGTTIFTESNNSGPANIKTISDFGMSVISSALEMSNVDLATEFSDMIITQRGFQANSKVTTVSDEMLETLVNMKR